MHFRSSSLVLAAALAAFLPAAARADEIEDSISAALDAYRAGDEAAAKEELDFAAQLLAQRQAAGFGEMLPGALDGWTREMEDPQALGGGLFGGGMIARASYTHADGRAVSIQMMADNPMVASMAAIMGNPAAMGSMGKVVRVGRQKAVVTPEGDVQALVANRVLVSVEGDAPEEDKLAYFSAIDLEALAAR